MEEWKDVVGYEGRYLVSNTGLIKSLNYNRKGIEKILKPTKNANGYLKVGLSKDGKTKQLLIHRIVAMAFLDNPENFEMVNHKDENVANNNVNNLEWCTRSYNQIYSMNIHQERAQLFGKNFKDKVTGDSISPMTKRIQRKHLSKVLQCDSDGNIIAVYNNVMEIHRSLGYDAGFIVKCCNGKYKTAYGFKWKWEQETA